jgi:hypothetical protein
MNTLAQCQTFLGTIFEPDDVIEFRPLPKASKRWGTIADLPEIVEWLARLNADGRHVYFGANPRKAEGGSKQEDVKLARCLFADFDNGIEPDAAMDRIAKAGLTVPTVILASGGGTHAWWRLSEPMTDLAEWTRRTKALIAAVGSDKTIHDAPRIMRLPGFVNHKHAHKPLAEIVECDPERVYPLADLAPRVSRQAPENKGTKVVPLKTAPDGGMSKTSREFLDHGTLLPSGGRRETAFTVACDLHAHGWTLGDAEAAIMSRAQCLGLTDDDLADIPRQIRSAFSKPRTPLGSTAATVKQPAAVTAKAAEPAEPYIPFPCDALPGPLASFAREAAAAIVCDEAYAALPVLVAAASAIGTTRRVELKGGYTALPILWGVTIGKHGTAKSAPLRLAVEPARLREQRLREEYGQERHEYETELEAYEKARAAWRQDRKGNAPAPERPAEPVGQRITVTETTVEALALKLADNPRGLLLYRDEIAGWLRGMDRYAKGGGSDESFFLSAYNGESHQVDRRTGDRREIYVSQAALWITGSIQPETLQRAIGQEHRESGLLARMLLAAPPPRPAVWSESEVSPLTRQWLHDTIERLYSLDADHIDAAGRRTSRLVRIGSDAKRAYVAWHDAHAAEIPELGADLAGFYSKLRETTARLALVIHEVRLAAGETLADEIEIDRESMDRAIRLADWFKYETRRVYRLLSEPVEDRVIRQADERLTAWLRRHGGNAAARDVVAGCRWIGNVEAAESALARLVEAGVGSWDDRPPGERGGRPARVFVLSRQHNPREAGKNEVVLTADTADIRSGEPEGGYIDL